MPGKRSSNRVQGGAGKKSITRSSPALKKDAAAASAKPIVAAGAQPSAQTIIYVHGIGNKPPAATLKCQWDNALFGVELGDRSRLAYWVNREFYPMATDDGCTSPDSRCSTTAETGGTHGSSRRWTPSLI